MNSKNYIVYKHTSPSNKIYIGITCQRPNHRWNKGKGYKENTYFTHAINKYGWENIKHEILFKNLSKEEAEQKEIELIAYYKSNIRKYGYNIENGGKVGKMSEETKKKLSLARKGKKGRKKTPEEIENIRKTAKENWKNIEYKNKITNIVKEKHGIKVVCVETNIIYNTLADAENDTGASRTYINICCKDKTKTSGGYHWKYYNNIKSNDTTSYRKNNIVNKKRIKQYDLNGNFIKEYSSIVSASRETGIEISKIKRNLKNIGLKVSQYIWKYS